MQNLRRWIPLAGAALLPPARGAWLFLALAGAAAGGLAMSARGADATVNDFLDVREVAGVPYRLFVPDGYDEPGNAGDHYPLVLFMHGKGQRYTSSGDPDYNRKQFEIPAPLVFVNSANRVSFPCFMVAPQISKSAEWDWGATRNAVKQIVENLMNRYRVDPDRIYVTGLSLGGIGTWSQLQNFPGFYAAAAPVCGSANTTDVLMINNAAPVPAWNFHGALDTTVPTYKSDAIIRESRKAGGRPNYTRYAGVGHDCWNRAYGEALLVPWVMAQRRGAPRQDVFDLTIAGHGNTHTTAATTLDLSGTAATTHGTVTQVTWYNTVIASGPGSLNNPAIASGAANWSAAGIPLFAGENRIVVTALDDGETTFSDTLVVTVTQGGAANEAPVAHAGDDFGLTLPTNSAALAGSYEDDGLPANGTAVTTWGQVSGPGEASFTDVHDPQTTAAFPSAGVYVLRLTAHDGELSGSDDVQVAVAGPGISGWTAEDIGNPGAAGSATESDGVFTVTGSGAIEAWYATDRFHFVHQSLTGDFDFVARVSGMTSEAGAGDAMLMVRTDLSPGSPFVAMNLLYSLGAMSEVRFTANANPTLRRVWGPVPPYWIRLVRAGNTFTCYRSANGTSWTLHEELAASLPATAYVGFAVTSDSPGNLTTAIFDHVSLVPANQAPVVSAGPDAGVQLPQTQIALAGVVTDDGLPAGGSLSTQWSVISGPGAVAFGDAASPATSASFGAEGIYVLRLTASDGALTASDELTVTVEAVDVWYSLDIGNPGAAGSAAESNGVTTITGSGAVEPWTTLDGFHLLYRELTGDFTMTARVTSITSAASRGDAMLVARASLDPGAPFVSMNLLYALGTQSLARQSSNTRPVELRVWGPVPPYWIRLMRTGDTFTCYRSANGVNWTLHNTLSVALPATLYIGLGVTSDTPGTTATATFESFELTTP